MKTNVVPTNKALDCAVTSLVVHSNRRGNCLYWELIFYSEFVFVFKFLAGNTATVIIFSVSFNIILSRIGVRTLGFDKKFFINRAPLTLRPSARNNWAPHWTDFHEI